MENEDKQIQLIKKFIPKIYPYQEHIIRYKGNELIINKSRQTGISYIVSAIALVRAIFMDRRELIVSPSLKQSKHVMDYIYKHLGNMKDAGLVLDIKEETKTSLIFEGGGQINSLPNSANTIRGYPADDIWIDEYAHFTNGTDKEIIEALTPSITRGGHVYKISTPFGNMNYFYKDWQREKIDKVLINWRECPDIKQEDIERIRADIGEDAFLQEYENQFLSDAENQEFPMALIASCINHEMEYQELDPSKEYIAGADIGRDNDLTAFTAFEKKGDKFTLVYKKIMKETPYNEQLNFFKYMLGNYKFLKFRIDESGIGNMLAEEIKRSYKKITPITFNNENKQEMVSNFKRLMQEHNLEYPNDPQIINSTRAIKRIYTASNYLRFDSDRDGEIGHSDLFWSMALGLYDESKRRKFVMPVSFDR